MTDITAQQAAAYLLRLRAASQSFMDFVKFIEPDFVLQDFQVELINALDLLEKRKLRNKNGELVYKMLVTMPPRVGKSTFVTELFPVYCMCKDPTIEVMSAAYNDELARTFGNKIRSRVTDPRVKQAFPNLGLSRASSSATHWRTETNGAYYGVGLQGTTTGRAANCFTGDTLVVTDKGARPISELKIGDVVLSLNVADKSVRLRKVVATMSKANQPAILFDGWLKCTPDQKVFDGDSFVVSHQARSTYGIKAFIGLKESADDPLVLPKEIEKATVSSVVKPLGLMDVFDIEVEEDHNFFVVNPENGDAICVRNCLIIDDPYRSRSEADSPTIRETVWSYYTAALRTRLQPTKSGKKPIQVVVHTRWHPDDLAGRIQKLPEWNRGEWVHLNYKAIIERPVDIDVRADGLPEDHPGYMPYEAMRAIRYASLCEKTAKNRGEEVRNKLPAEYEQHRHKQFWVKKTSEEVSIWEERFPLVELKKMRELDPREFDALYQQSPTIVGGNMIKPAWFRYYENKPEKFISLIISADTAFKAKSKNDYSVLMAGGLTEGGDIYLLDLIREKLEFPDLKRQFVLFASRFRPLGLRGIYVEDKASGQSIIQELKTTAPAPVIPFNNPGNSDKVARLASITPLIASGKVFLPKSAPWLSNFLTEAGQFPSSPNDDQMDALYILVDVLSRIPIATQEILTAPIGTLFQNDALGSPFAGQLRSNAQGWQGNWKNWQGMAIGE